MKFYRRIHLDITELKDYNIIWSPINGPNIICTDINRTDINRIIVIPNSLSEDEMDVFIQLNKQIDFPFLIGIGGILTFECKTTSSKITAEEAVLVSISNTEKPIIRFICVDSNGDDPFTYEGNVNATRTINNLEKELLDEIFNTVKLINNEDILCQND
jgi:hypothetical protein